MSIERRLTVIDNDENRVTFERVPDAFVGFERIVIRNFDEEYLCAVDTAEDLDALKRFLNCASIRKAGAQ